MKKKVKIKTWSMMLKTGTYSLEDGGIEFKNGYIWSEQMETFIPLGRVIEVENEIWIEQDYNITDEMILHEYFEIGETVYMRNHKKKEWVETEFKMYDYNSTSPFVDEYGECYKYCMSEKEYEEKYSKKYDVHIFPFERTSQDFVYPQITESQRNKLIQFLEDLTNEE